MPRTNPPYPLASRAEAVQLVLSDGKSIPIIASRCRIYCREAAPWYPLAVTA